MLGCNVTSIGGADQSYGFGIMCVCVCVCGVCIGKERRCTQSRAPDPPIRHSTTAAWIETASSYYFSARIVLFNCQVETHTIHITMSEQEQSNSQSQPW